MMIVKMLTALTTKSAFTAGANALHFICIFCSAAQERKTNNQHYKTKRQGACKLGGHQIGLFWSNRHTIDRPFGWTNDRSYVQSKQFINSYMCLNALEIGAEKSVYSNYDEDHDDVDDDYFPFYRFVIMKISSSLMMTILMFTSFMMTIMLAAVKETFWFIDFFIIFFCVVVMRLVQMSCI